MRKLAKVVLYVDERRLPGNSNVMEMVLGRKQQYESLELLILNRTMI